MAPRSRNVCRRRVEGAGQEGSVRGAGQVMDGRRGTCAKLGGRGAQPFGTELAQLGAAARGLSGCQGGWQRARRAPVCRT